jgi:proteic killer suppression protein
MAKNSLKNKLIEKYSNVEYYGNQVNWSHRVEKQLDRLPSQIQMKFHLWVESIRVIGITRVRMRPGLHDEPLKGRLEGQRSVRLNIAYRAIYIEVENGELKIIQVIEVNKHEY